MSGNWANFGVRVVLLPVFAVKALAQLPQSIIREEPSRSAAYGARTTLASATPNGINTAKLAATTSGLPGTCGPLRLPLLVGKPEIQLVWRRLIDMANKSLELLYEAFVYNFIVSFVKILGAGVLLTALEPHFRSFLALFIGKYKLRHPEPGDPPAALYSFANSCDITFDLPAEYAHDFPFVPPALATIRAKQVGEAKRGHLGGMAAKLAYEDPVVIRDVVKSWGFSWLGDQKATHGSTTVPETYWFAFHNAHAVIICFRGTSPLNLINWQTDIDLGLSPQPGFPGEVHDGFYNALFGEAHEKQSLDGGLLRRRAAAAPTTVFGDALAALNEGHVHEKAIFVCGHSLGGALTAVFGTALGVHAASAAARLARGGLLTYGQPRVGNAEFADAYDDALGPVTRRYVHAADVVPKVPVGLGYTHHGLERFIPSFDIANKTERILDNPGEIAAWERRDAVWALAFGFAKLLWSPIPPAESFLRLLSRVALLPLPGLSDHFPGDYEVTLRENVARVTAAAPARG